MFYYLYYFYEYNNENIILSLLVIFTTYDMHFIELR